MECSAITQKNLAEVFHTAAKEVIKRRKEVPDVPVVADTPAEATVTTTDGHAESSGCCVLL